jgi:hypothetical protein
VLCGLAKVAVLVTTGFAVLLVQRALKLCNARRCDAQRRGQTRDVTRWVRCGTAAVRRRAAR